VTTLGLPQYIFDGPATSPTAEHNLGNGYQQVSSQALDRRTFSILSNPLDTHDLHANLDKIKRQHEFKFGYEGRMHRIAFCSELPRSQFNYTQTGTSRHIRQLRGRRPGVSVDRLSAGRERLRPSTSR